MNDPSALHEAVHNFVISSVEPPVEPIAPPPRSPLWQRLRELGTALWLDSGSMDDTAPLWTAEMTALTTNNSLLNKEVQNGQYDELVPAACEALKPFGLDERHLLLELAFILNAHHGLRLVQRYGCFVSVEEHTDLANDLDGAVTTARRFHAICPERFIVKLPLTPAGLLATRVIAGEGIPVNHTLGFSARQNVMIARIGRPAYVNVFLGRLNSFVSSNALGDGSLIGEKATLASQTALRKLSAGHGATTRQIAASMRSGEQVAALAGVDVFTMPPKAAAEFVASEPALEGLVDQTGVELDPPLAEGVDPAQIGLPTLWDVNAELVETLDALERENLDDFTAPDLVAFFGKHGCGDLLVDWTAEQIAASAAEGKIPVLAHWSEALASGRIGLDALMNLAGLNAFRQDQKAMDERVRSHILQAGCL